MNDISAHTTSKYCIADESQYGYFKEKGDRIENKYDRYPSSWISNKC